MASIGSNIFLTGFKGKIIIPTVVFGNRPDHPLFVIIRLDRMIQKGPAGPRKELDRYGF
jgi:hypothetical protein